MAIRHLKSLDATFLALGHKLHGDAETRAIRFIQGDVFKLELPSPLQPVTPTVLPVSQVGLLSDFLGRAAVVYTGALFHLFDEPTQYAMALRLALLVREGKPAIIIIIGRHQGLPQAGLIDDYYARVRYSHSPESWAQLWKAVFVTIRGEYFAKNKVSVNAELRSSNGSTVTAAGKLDTYTLFWSVEVSL